MDGTSKDRDFNLCRISGDNMWPVKFIVSVVQRFDNMTILQTIISIIIYLNFPPYIYQACVAILGFCYKHKHNLRVLSELLCP